MSLVFVVIHFFHLYWLLQPFSSCYKSLCCLEFILFIFSSNWFCALLILFFFLYIVFYFVHLLLPFCKIILLLFTLSLDTSGLWICGLLMFTWVCVIVLSLPSKTVFQRYPIFSSVCVNEESKLEWKKGFLELKSFFSPRL